MIKTKNYDSVTPNVLSPLMNDGFGQWLSIAIKTFKWNFDEEYYNRGKSGNIWPTDQS